MTWDTAEATVAGYSLASIAASYPSNWPFGGGLYSVVVFAWLYLQETSYNFGYGSLWSLAGLTHVPGGDHPPSLSAAGLWLAVWRPPLLSTPSGEGDCPRHKIPAMGVAKHH
jgi:hypothetical protein